MERGTITISVGNDITKEEIEQIRKLFKQNYNYKTYTFNIIVCGNNNFKEDLKNFIKAGIKS